MYSNRDISFHRKFTFRNRKWILYWKSLFRKHSESKVIIILISIMPQNIIQDIFRIKILFEKSRILFKQIGKVREVSHAACPWNVWWKLVFIKIEQYNVCHCLWECSKWNFYTRARFCNIVENSKQLRSYCNHCPVNIHLNGINSSWQTLDDKAHRYIYSILLIYIYFKCIIQISNCVIDNC